ncbi:MAG: transposase, partial [Janthinobacterium lividum]
AWRCPSGHMLRLAGFERSRGIQKYSAQAVDCGACALKPQCTIGKARGLNVSIHEPARKAVQALAGTTAYFQSQRWRQKVEILFAHLKQQFGIRRLRLRGLQGAAEEFHLAAAVQNLRRLIRLTVCGLSGQAGTAAFG